MESAVIKIGRRRTTSLLNGDWEQYYVSAARIK